VVGLLAALALGQTKPETNSSSGSIQGVVFTTEQDGARSVVPGTKLSLDGPVHLQAESDPDGKVEFNAVTPGSYTITAEAPGLAATQNIEVRAGSVSQLELEMRLQAVTESTTVTASTEQVDTKESSGSPIIAQSTVAHAPNRNERFEDLLPLVPGVVRGPNGRINMKGARPSESGSLVNSADVTDPATGESAINIPIDVVSSVQVLSAPYNPQYGKFTGAVSSSRTTHPRWLSRSRARGSGGDDSPSSFAGTRHIDWAFVRRSSQPIDGRVLKSVKASDHYPIFFELQLSAAQQKVTSSGYMSLF